MDSSRRKVKDPATGRYSYYVDNREVSQATWYRWDKKAFDAYMRDEEFLQQFATVANDDMELGEAMQSHIHQDDNGLPSVSEGNSNSDNNPVPIPETRPNVDMRTGDEKTSSSQSGKSSRLCDVFREMRIKLEKGHDPAGIWLRTALTKWSIKHEITRDAFDDLLFILQEMDEEAKLSLPKDSRGLKPRLGKHIKIVNMTPGRFAYIGIKETLDLPGCKFFKKEDQILRLSINVDGLPAFKSGTNEFYPIFGRINGGKVFLIGLYFGKEKPTDANEFIRPLVDEIRSFYKNVRPGDKGQAYIELNDGEIDSVRRYEFAFDMIVTDAVAKAWLLSIKGHAGYYSCTKCKICGTISPKNKKVYFPGEYDAMHRCGEEYLDIDWDDLKNVIEKEKKKCPEVVREEQPEHNESIVVREEYILAEDDAYDIPFDENEEKPIPEEARRNYHKRKPELARIPCFDLVLRVVLDPMHLLLCGLLKRMLCFYFTNEKTCFEECKNGESLTKMSRRMKEIGTKYWPQEFHSGRRPESMLNIVKWKCTQFRDFLLYFGIVVLKGGIKSTYYDQFVTLSACIRYLSMKASPQEAAGNIEMAQYIKKVFRFLLDSFQTELGLEFMLSRSNLLGRNISDNNSSELHHDPIDSVPYNSVSKVSTFYLDKMNDEGHHKLSRRSRGGSWCFHQ